MFRVLTLWRSEEVEEGVVGDGLGDRPDRATPLVFLLLLDGLERDVLALRPVNRTTVGQRRIKGKVQTGNRLALRLRVWGYKTGDWSPSSGCEELRR